MTDIVICDDRKEILADLKEKIEKIESVEGTRGTENIGKTGNFERTDVHGAHRILAYSDGLKMLGDLEDGRFSECIFILDIELGNCNGINVGERILTVLPDAQIIFMSGYDDYYEDVYDVSHIYFLQKPVSETSLTKALAIADKRLLDVKQDCFYVENRSGRFVVPYSKIYFFEKQNRKIVLVGKDSEGICSFYGKIDDILPELPHNFCRCHNGIIVNMDRIARLSQNTFVMTDDQLVAISRRHRNTALTAFAGYAVGTTDR